jgi:hypothetical protein
VFAQRCAFTSSASVAGSPPFEMPWASTRAAAAARCGEAIDVPLSQFVSPGEQNMHEPVGTVDWMLSPGDAKSIWVPVHEYPVRSSAGAGE